MDTFSMREAAIGIHESYLALVEAGFTQEQAFELLKVSMAAPPMPDLGAIFGGE